MTIETEERESVPARRRARKLRRMNRARAERAEALRLELVRLRTDLAWLCSDRAHGGPSRDEEIAELRARIRQLEM